MRNPVYAIADQDILNYFLNNGVEIYNEYNQFDGSHGIIGYCKTEKPKQDILNIKIYKTGLLLLVSIKVLFLVKIGLKFKIF